MIDIKTFIEYPDIGKPRRLRKYILIWCSKGDVTVIVDEKELEKGGDFDSSDRDPLFEEAARLIVQNQVGSTSLIQRRMKLGYNRAGRLMDQLEAAGEPRLGPDAHISIPYAQLTRMSSRSNASCQFPTPNRPFDPKSLPASRQARPLRTSGFVQPLI